MSISLFLGGVSFINGKAHCNPSLTEHLHLLQHAGPTLLGLP